MGRWTPLILMAGGLAILLGTLLGISFPMGGQNNAQSPAPASRNRASRVLPANINVNSSGTGGNNNPPANNRNNIAQTNQGSSSSNDQTQVDKGNTDNTTETNQETDANQGNEPIRALW